MVKNKDIIKKKIAFLIDFAVKQSKDTTFSNPFIYDYIKIAFKLAKKINYRLPSSIHRKVCKKCYSIRTTDNTKIRAENRIVNKKKQKYLKIHCLACGNIKKINLSKCKDK